MISITRYIPVHDKILYSPLRKENLRLDFSSLDHKLDDLSLLTTLMIRDQKSIDDIVSVTSLSRAVIEDIVSTLKTQNLLNADGFVPENTLQILRMSDYINSFNVNSPRIFSDLLNRIPMILQDSVDLKTSKDDEDCVATVKNFEKTSAPEFEDIARFVKNFLKEHGAADFLNDLQVIRFKQPEILFATRKIRFIPVIGENNFNDCVNIEASENINAELPVHKFKLKDGQEFYVDLLLETTFTLDESEQLELDSEEILISFKPCPDYAGDVLINKYFAMYQGNIEDCGIHHLKVSISKNVLGDFL